MNIKATKYRWIILAVLMAAVMLPLSACGGTTSTTSSGDTSSGSTSSGSTSSESASSESTSTATETTTQSDWPDNAETANVPRPTFSAAPISVINSNNLVAITYSGIADADARTYLQQLKDAGFTSVDADTDVSGTISYVARNPETLTHLSYSYTASSGSLTVSLDRFGV